MRTASLSLVLILAVASVMLMAPRLSGAAPDYAIVVSVQTAGDAGWRKVVDVLAARHKAGIITFSNSVDESLPALKKQFPRYACFVAQPEEVTREFVADVHRLTRQLDDDPYTDCFWGILTGYDSTNALSIARQAHPLIIRKVLSGTELDMEMTEEGVSFSELEKGRSVRKVKGGIAQEVKCPDDSTESLVDALNEGQPDLFVTSGHATEHDWMIGFSYRNGFFKHADGNLYGEDTQKRILPIYSPNPKIYMPIGNCLMGHIDRRDCMATAWMNSAGVCQMIGYTVTTWYGYGGWGLLDYFVEQPGRYTFNEAFFANQIALENRLGMYFPELLKQETDVVARDSEKAAPGDAAKAAGLTRQDGLGLLYDRDTVAFYGDPAWQARMAECPKAFDQKLKVSKGTFTFEIKPRRGAESFKPVNLNGSQRGGRPFLAYLPYRVRGVRISSGMELKPVVTDNFILVPNSGDCDPAKTYRVVFTAIPLQ
jgi:zinc protease